MPSRRSSQKNPALPKWHTSLPRHVSYVRPPDRPQRDPDPGTSRLGHRCQGEHRYLPSPHAVDGHVFDHVPPKVCLGGLQGLASHRGQILSIDLRWRQRARIQDHPFSAIHRITLSIGATRTFGSLLRLHRSHSGPLITMGNHIFIVSSVNLPNLF